jgi:hypothetical protein
MADGKIFTEFLQLATSVFDALRAIVGVCGKDDLYRFTAQIQELFGLGNNLHPIFTGSGAGSDDASIDLDHTYSTVSKCGQIFVITEVGDRIACLGAGCKTWYLGNFTALPLI